MKKKPDLDEIGLFCLCGVTTRCAGPGILVAVR
jgi:hypothetical protein